MYINIGEIRVKKHSCHHILLSFLLGVIFLLSGISAGAAETEDNPERSIVSGMKLTPDGSYVQGTIIAADNYSQANNSSNEISLSSGLKAYFYFKGPSLKEFMEKVKVENDKLDYYRALFGLNISF
jgi:hypothetical protein